MSASLVGSEMCIRDSPPVRAGRCSKHFGACRRVLQTLWGLQEDAPRPVSYTHLTLPTICSV
eukprot:13300878-Alexandrium_andersonii.AAC.1